MLPPSDANRAIEKTVREEWGRILAALVAHLGDLELAEAEAELSGATPAPATVRSPLAPMDPSDQSTWGKVPRNAPCPCGSGKKFKHCHGRLV